MFGYIYKTTNLINNKIYIGQHKSETFDTNYYGSGKLLIKALNKYGKQAFEVVMLEAADDPDTLSKLEIYYIKKYNSAHSKNGYNMSDGGHVPRLSKERNGNYGHKWTAEQRKAASIRKLKENLSPETREKMSLAKRGKHLSGENNKAHAIVKLSKDKKYINSYPTLRDGAKDLEKELNYTKTAKSIEYNICATCRHRQYTSYGYIWMYEEEYLKKGETK